MRPIYLPTSYNYIGVFLTLRCNLGCSYCLNAAGKCDRNRHEMSWKDWQIGLNRIISRPDLPITLQGGEPTLHKDFYEIVNRINPKLNIDLLTNGKFSTTEFINQIEPDRMRRVAKYASIRFSYHPGFSDESELLLRVDRLRIKGYSVGIWGVDYPNEIVKKKMEEFEGRCNILGIDFRKKEFLGLDGYGILYGTYKYPEAILSNAKSQVMCKPSELLIGPNGNIYRCHSDLYAGINEYANILDRNVELLDDYRSCGEFGFCNPCDVKIKTNRFQEFGHTSVEIKRRKNAI